MARSGAGTGGGVMSARDILQAAAGNAGGGEGSWDITTAVYSQSFSVAAQETSPCAVAFKPDGTKMYVAGYSGDDVDEYTLSTAWDVTTASYVSTANNLAGTDLRGVWIDESGTKVYCSDRAGLAVKELTLSTAWDITTFSLSNTLDISGSTASPLGLFVNQAGTGLYVIDNTNDRVLQYTLSTAWDVSTATFTTSFTQAGAPSGVFLRPNGADMYILDYGTDAISQYTLSTPWDVSTASYVGVFSANAQDTTMFGMYVRSDGFKLYTVGAANDSVYEYDMT